MAGDWIKMRTNLWDDTRVGQVCELVNQGEATVIGAMYWLWAMADHQTVDGVMQGLSCATIDRKTGVPGFANALVTAGWLEANAEGVTISHFSDHNGASAKSRAQTAKRVANHKTNAKVTQEGQTGNAPTVTNALPREEKRREEKIEGQNLSSDPAGSDMAKGQPVGNSVLLPEDGEQMGGSTAGAGGADDGENGDDDLPEKGARHHSTEEDRECAAWLFSKCILPVNPGAKQPSNWNAWGHHIRLMREQDERSHRQICELFQWVSLDTFWQSVILSPQNLRKQWDRLILAKNKVRPASTLAPKSIYDQGMENAAKAKELLFGKKDKSGEVVDV